MPVVFYHLGLGGFTGGYVGVDVFSGDFRLPDHFDHPARSAGRAFQLRRFLGSPGATHPPLCSL
ncbi:hypothetical protein ACPA9J_19635 [Pseudomonas aeruginosa]